LDDIDRPGVRVVVNPGGTNAEFDKQHLRNAQIATYPDNNTIFEQLTGNAADVMITDASEVRWETNQDPQLCGVGLDHPFTFEQKGYLVPKAATDFQQWINEWLNIAQNDGTYSELSRKYLGAVIGP
jgi:cyclohexadienyl dehydratase